VVEEEKRIVGGGWGKGEGIGQSSLTGKDSFPYFIYVLAIVSL